MVCYALGWCVGPSYSFKKLRSRGSAENRAVQPQSRVNSIPLGARDRPVVGPGAESGGDAQRGEQKERHEIWSMHSLRPT